jgi:hypothetical protein
MAGIPEILIFLGVIVILCVFIAFIHAWLSKESQPTSAGEKRERYSTQDESVRSQEGSARHGYFGRSDSGTVGSNR